MVRALLLVSVLIHCGLSASLSHAQLFRGNAAPPAARETNREPARVGLLGGRREVREERIRREEQAATAARVAAAQAAAAQRNAAANTRGNAAASAKSPAAVANNNALRDSAPRAGTKPDATIRSSNFRGQENLGLANSKINPNNTLSRPTPVTPASATTFVPAPLGYDGPGVVIRLPKDAHSVVNYLVDEAETNAIRPGEEQVFDSKGSYIVRYSRGVTRDGRSYGESRYTITEGRYRFELTATGWELYRELDADAKLAPPNRLELAENLLNDSPVADVSPMPSPQSELPRVQPNQSAEKLVPSEPALSERVVNEEVLPAPKPRSILE